MVGGVVLVASVVARAAGAGDTLPPVVVRAPRTDGDLSTAPEAVTRLPGEELEASDVTRTGDLTAYAPNLTVRQSGDRKSAFIGVRGIANAPFGEPAVGIYVDGVPYLDVRDALIDLYDVAEVDVWRGPQTTRVGRNAEAGAIAIETRRPTGALSADGSVRYGNYDTQIYQAAVGGPIVQDKAYFRFAGIESKRDGYVENTFLHTGLDDRDMRAARGEILLLPIRGLELDLTGEGRHADDGAQAFTLLSQPDPFRVAYDTHGRQRTEGWLGALRATYAVDAIRLSSITSYRSLDIDRGALDLDFTPRDLAVLEDNHHLLGWTEEARIASAREDARWHWEVGGYFEGKSTHPDLTARADSTQLIQAPPPIGLGLPFTEPVSNVQHGDIHADTRAGFGRSRIALGDRAELTLGFRYESYTIAMDRTHLLSAPAEHVVAPAVPPFHVRDGTSAWLPETALAYRVAPFLLSYVRIARGYRPGGFSPFSDDPVAAAFRPQFDWSYEAGAKSTWLEDRLAANLSVFDVQVHDYQVEERVGLTSFALVNAHSVATRGVDLDATARPVRDVDVRAAFGFVDARYERFEFRGQRFDGNELQLVPPYQFSLAAQYRHRTGVFGRIELQGIGPYAFLEGNRVGQSAYQLVNATLGWQGRHVGVYAFGRNLNDATYSEFALPGGPRGSFITTPGEPRTFGILVSASF